MKQILEIQAKADLIYSEIEKLQSLIDENEPDDENIESILTQLNDQRNELLIAEKMGSDNKAQITEIDKTIKATKNAEAKAKEQRELIRAIERKVQAKNDALIELAKEHQKILVEHLKGLVIEKQEKRERALQETLKYASEIAALDHIARYKAGFGRDLCSEAFMNQSFLNGLNHGDIFPLHKLQQAKNEKMELLLNEFEQTGLRVRLF